MKQRKKRTQIYSTNNLFVYPTDNGTFSLEGVIHGRRIRARAKTLEEAKSKCHSLEEGKQTENVTRTLLDQKQLREAERAFERLPEGVSLSEAVESFLSNYSVSQTPLVAAVWRYLETKEHRQPETYKDAKNKLLRFSTWGDGKHLETFTTTDATEFLAGVPEGSFNHFLRHCKGLFKWAERESLITANPYAHIKLRTRQHTEVGVLSCDEANALLEASERLHGGELLPYVCITLFAGLRPDSEMKHLTWEAINLEDAEIRVTKGKTQTPRTVEMPTNLLQWLLICDRTRPIYPTNFRRKWAVVRQAAGFRGGIAKTQKQKEAEAERKPWVKDYTRHSAISYRVRQKGDINTTATWAGNSPAIIRTNYLGLVSGREAANFWSLEPSSNSRVATNR
jgi:site-specific recombinase XerD